MKRMRTYFLMVLLGGGYALAATAESRPEVRNAIDLTGSWKFSGYLNSESPTDAAVTKGFHTPGFDDTAWKPLRVPFNWYRGISQGESGLEFGSAFSSMYTEGWYRRSVQIPAEYRGKRVIFRCDDASVETWVFVNGTNVGYHFGQFSPFEFDVTQSIRFGALNLLAVRCRVDHIDERHGNLFRAGLCLPVKLLIVPEVHIKRTCINPRLASSRIDIEYSIMNAGPEARSVTVEGTVDNQAQRLGTLELRPGLNTATLRMSLKDPVPWSPENPHLYHLVTTLKADGNVVDRTTERFGFREFTARGPHLYLNGKRYYLFGAGSYGVSGSIYRWGTTNLLPAEERERIRKDFVRERKIGVNFLRAHSGYTPPKYILEAADETGMLFYNQWSYICGKGRLKGEYIQKHIDDMKEYIYDAYNNPSLVMFTFTNEIFSSDAREAAFVYDSLKAAFPDRLLLTPSSGGTIYTFAKKTKTDVIDLHNYTGWPFKSDLANVKRSWRFMEDTVREEYANAKPVCGSKPLIITEFPAYSIGAHWVNISPLRTGKVTPETYVAATRTPPGNWPISMYDLKTRSLRDRLEMGKGWRRGEALMVKRAAESLRRLDILSGLEPNCMLNNLDPIYKTLYRPVFICAGIFDTNLFTGDTLKYDVYLINDTSTDRRDLKAEIRILDRTGKTVHTGNFTVDTLAGFTKKIVPFTYTIPENLVTGLYDVKLFLSVGKEQVSDNYYDFYVLNKADLKPIGTRKRILLVSTPNDHGGGEKFRQILTDMNLKFDILGPKDRIDEKLRQCDVVVIAPNYNAKVRSWNELGKNWPGTGRAIHDWIARGGRAISLEQYVSGPLPWAENWEVYDAGNCWYVDTAVPAHPVYRGLIQRNFDSWNAFQGVSDQSYFIRAMTENVIAAVGATSDDRYVMAAAEARIGKGVLFASQLNATQRYMKDSVATQYIYNLLAYALTDIPYNDVREMQDTGYRPKPVISVDPRKCNPIDLRPYANRGFTDEQENDGKGGWTDQGQNDLRHVPLGTQEFAGVPFKIIDPKTNNGKSCLILKGDRRPAFPEAIRGIGVNRKADALAFLHTAAWCPPGAAVGTYRIHYADATCAETTLQEGRQIGDWWDPQSVLEADIAWRQDHPQTKVCVGLYLFLWKNPFPGKTISSLDFVSSGSAVPVLLAVTAMMVNGTE